jgi:cobalamin biosynthesis protein CobD/CbiB
MGVDVWRNISISRIFGHRRAVSVNQQSASVKIFWGILLLFLTPVFLFVRPITKTAVVRDLLHVIWWAFILWLLITGKKESIPTDSK